jgi:hypothetical protein
MQIGKIYSQHGGRELWEKTSQITWLERVFLEDKLQMVPGASESIRSHVEMELAKAGWALNFPVDPEFNLVITAKKDQFGFQIQTGNISRAAYDLIKLQTMYLSRQIDAACLAVPSGSAASKLGGNLANGNRLSEELKLFSRHITVPLILVTFE